MDRDVLQLDGLGQAEKIRAGELTAAALVDAAIAEIEAVNPTLNCVVIARFDQARAEAERLDTSGSLSGPFAGVPALLKDLGQEIEGLGQTDGSRAVISHPPDRDSMLAARYRQAGMILLGKTSSPEFGNHSTTEPAVHGPCRNPWDTGRTVGGSSGGSAAAVAARMVAVAGASDGAGSIRIPASCCGVFGLKPSRGRISSTADGSDSLFGLATVHAITRTVRDSAAVLDISSGVAPEDPRSLPGPARRFAEEAAVAPGSLRIGMSTAH
ncbi:MAG: amidase, partial [Actinomycetota bacterium]|nr:amidase [Actinomycetota bacterium]